MKYKILIIVLFISFLLNFHLISLLNKSDVSIQKSNLQNIEIKNLEKENKLSKDLSEKEINRNFFPENIELKDYSTVKYTLESNGKDIIKSIREFHKSPTLISKAYRDKDLCAGFIWSLSEEIWGEHIPYYIGMMTPDTRVPAKAWELPYSYLSYGGEILFDISEKIDLSNFKQNYLNLISKDDFLKFFSLSFSENSLFGDIGFLYRDTSYLEPLKSQGYYNSHITKNMGISEFIMQINFGGNFDNHEFVFKKLFESRFDNLDKFEKVLSSYKFYINGKEMIYDSGDFFYTDSSWKLKNDRVEFKILDNISYKDISIVHYYHKKARVESLLAIVLGGEFFPINIMSINSRFIEKM